MIPVLILTVVSIILNIAIILYILFTLSTIKFEVRRIAKHLNIKDDNTMNSEEEYVSNDEIEKQLEMMNNGKEGESR
ncbi:hypothetical protein AM500_04575 [Bacillus sp. FJAT-18017]|uniref:hypothetical protein n=1 Tax=Bacillus sp. FJAT-18017 TaxID=1705566 RepID=UPI0006AE2845|nr:hypothetical protein [Bacillus sp. FJAT-18017]ALC89146.1 hypothetical protein AM500_04575 [Bacillus sp. FJAT-18017]